MDLVLCSIVTYSSNPSKVFTVFCVVYRAASVFPAAARGVTHHRAVAGGIVGKAGAVCGAAGQLHPGPGRGACPRGAQQQVQGPHEQNQQPLHVSTRETDNHPYSLHFLRNFLSFQRKLLFISYKFVKGFLAITFLLLVISS